MTWRRLRVLVRHLPPESATLAAANQLDQQWSTTDHLLANVVDALNAGNWQRAGNKRAPKPKPIPRPSRRSRNRSTLTPHQMRERLLAQRRREAHGRRDR